MPGCMQPVGCGLDMPGVGCQTLIRFSVETKLGRADDTAAKECSCAAIQCDLGSPEKWADRNLNKFNKEERKVLPQVKDGFHLCPRGKGEEDSRAGVAGTLREL